MASILIPWYVTYHGINMEAIASLKFWCISYTPTFISKHYSDVTMSDMASQILCNPTVCLTVCSRVPQRKYQSSKDQRRKSTGDWLSRPVTWKIFPCHDIIMFEYLSKGRIRLPVSTVNRTYELTAMTHVTATENIRMGPVFTDGESVPSAGCFTVSPLLGCVVIKPSRMKSICTEGCHMGHFREFVCTSCCIYGQSNKSTVHHEM